MEEAVKLPLRLAREPLVEVVFEVRMGGAPQIADLVPGAIFAQLQPKPVIQRLPAAEIPQPVRHQDPRLIFAPVIRLDWGRFTASFGDQNLVIGCKLPYPKWPAFRDEILRIIGKIAEIGIVGPVERYSLKYVNLIQAPTIAGQIAKISMAVKVGDVEVSDDHISLQVHRNEDGTLHILSVMTGAEAKMPDGATIFGVIVDIDSIRAAHFTDFGAFANQITPALESLRRENKTKFFNCLTAATIEEMGPEYD